MEYIVIGAMMVCGLFLLQTARWLFSDHGALGGAAAAILGVVLLGLTVVYVAPALLDTEKAKLAEQIAKLTKEGHVLKADKVKLEADIKRHATEQESAASRLADLERKRLAELEGLSSGVEELRGRMTTSQVGMMVDRPYLPETTDKADRLRAEVRALTDFRMRPTAAAAPPRRARRLPGPSTPEGPGAAAPSPSWPYGCCYFRLPSTNSISLESLLSAP